MIQMTGKAGQARQGKLAWGVRGANEPPNNAMQLTRRGWSRME